jgi:hypothetical protein
MTPRHSSTLALRMAQPDEAAVIRRLADLDDAAPLEGQVLLALVDGEAIAAVSLHDRRVVANPFVRTTDAVTLLGLRASQLAGPRAPQRFGLGRIPRLHAA